MSRQPITDEIKKLADESISQFNARVIRDPNRYYVARYKSSYLYLDRLAYGEPWHMVRLTYTGDPANWEFAIYKHSDERYDAAEWFFPGSEHVDGTIEGAMKAGLEAYP